MTDLPVIAPNALPAPRNCCHRNGNRNCMFLEFSADADIGGVLVAAAIAVAGDDVQREVGVETMRDAEAEAGFTLKIGSAKLPCGLARR